MYSDTPNIVPFPVLPNSAPLSASQIAALQAGTLRLLDEVGVHLPSSRALQIFADHGARVDWETQIVRIPPDLVRRAMANAPRSFVLAGREPRLDLLLDGTHSYLCTDGTGVHVIDPQTRQVRPSRQEDVARLARVCDALPLVSFFWPSVAAQDHPHTAPLHQCHAALTNTLKHVRGGMTVPPHLAPFLVEMATVVAGSAAALRQRPPICANICTIAPLGQDDAGIECALTFAAAGIPVSLMAMPTMGSTAPATPLGALVVGDAEVVSAMVLIQLAYPGAPVLHSIIASLMDPRSGGYIGEVPAPLPWIAVQLAHAWNVPCLGGGSLSTDAASVSWQCGMESGMGAATIPLYGGEICGYIGLTGGSMILYPEKVILDHETCQAAYDLLHGFAFDESDMALDVVARVGPRGHFLAQKHTRRRIRDFYYSPLLRQKDAQGQPRDPREVARERFDHLAATHHPQPLPNDVLAELERILTAADRTVDGRQ